MMEKMSESRQLYKTVDSDDVVNKVKQVLKDCFHSAAAMQVVELQPNFCGIQSEGCCR